MDILLQIRYYYRKFNFKPLVGCYHIVSHSFIVKAAAAGSTLDITDYNLCSRVSSFAKRVVLVHKY